jgi:hypothetical protein
MAERTADQSRNALTPGFADESRKERRAGHAEVVIVQLYRAQFRHAPGQQALPIEVVFAEKIDGSTRWIWR